MAQPRTKQQRSRKADAGLAEREYRDSKGKVHHHTRSYMERGGEDTDERRQRRRPAKATRQRRREPSDGGSRIGDFARSLANRPGLLLVAAAAAGTFLMSRRIADGGDEWRQSFERDDEDQSHIPGASWLRDTVMPSPETPRDVFVTGLRNAHSVEIKATQLLERQIEALSDYPDMRARLEQHLGETRTQIDRLENILGQLDESPSTMKDTLLAAFGNALVMPQGMAGDAILKGAFASFAFENYEIAAYRSLIAMTELVAMPQFRPLLETTLSEETSMAQWVGDNIEALTRRHMAEVEEG